MEKYKLGLTLSGGGMSCAAQIGVLKVFEEEGISPSIISGASGGAIVGALLAKGIPCEEILKIFKKVDLFSFTHFIHKKPGLFDIESYQILEQYFPEDSFESLKIPLIINATHLQKGTTVYFFEGKLIKKIFASSAFPALFAPVNINNKLFADGGILENLPTSAIRKKCQKLIAINVNAVPEISAPFIDTTMEVFSRAIRLTLNHQKTFKQEDCDVLITPNAVAEHPLFSKNSVDKLFEIGYKEGKKQINQLKKLLSP
ncbi:MAG: patatin-like phospholipase family protein [Vicingaceae bacterium]